MKSKKKVYCEKFIEPNKSTNRFDVQYAIWLQYTNISNISKHIKYSFSHDVKHVT